ncbi:hypothetical protein M5J20_00540 [Corynebacterium sp. TA-R-1]|uniref:Secreted protein n=1 Tax=Corynebacterium stercoris TaxID=2943490 RepID=A0ABT1FY72_9CORY|nr:hypothetical protein [Corynebacterium stercoris]MCP1386689.1 hypothetical protein [Corynebacterium stercoris]
MTMQPRPNNPIEQRKQAMRKYMNNAAMWAGGGVAGGIALALLTQSWTLLIIGFVIAVAGGWTNWNKAQQIVNHKDEY